jgi:hypothetical protein
MIIKTKLYNIYTHAFLLMIFFSLSTLHPVAYAQIQNKHQLSLSHYSLNAHHLHGFDFSAYLDTSYNYLLQKNSFKSSIQDRVFDIEPNGFTLQQMAFTLAKKPEQGLGGLVNIVGGRDANKLAAYGWNPYFGSQTLALDFTQVYLQYVLAKVTLIAGKFATLAGAETYNPIHDINFSRSILDGYAEPSTHLGLRGRYDVNNKLHLTAGINNGWDSIRDTGRPKTIELGIAYEMNSLFSLTAQGYSGGERLIVKTAKGPIGRRNLIDIVATFKVHEHLMLVANYDYGMQTKAALPNGQANKAVWQGLAAYVNYVFTDDWYTAFRGEIFYDKNGYMTGVRQDWRELTLTLGYAPNKQCELRVETRHDLSNVNAFVSNHHRYTRNHQQSFAVEGIYKL